VLDYAM